MAKMQIEMMEIESIRPYENNPRKNSAAVEAVAESIKKFGFRQPIVCDTQKIIVVGHTRWKAAKKLGLTTVPVHIADLSEVDAKSYRIADNRLQDIAEWDREILPLELAELAKLDVSLESLGFNNCEIEKYLGAEFRGTQGITESDFVPEMPDEPETKIGDLWILGNHRLMCGDSAKPEDVDCLLAGVAIQLVNTDPPYNANIEPRSNTAVALGTSDKVPCRMKGKNKTQKMDIANGEAHPERALPTARPKDRPLEGDFISDEEFYALLLKWFGNIHRPLAAGRSFYIWGGYANIKNYFDALIACDLRFSQTIIWEKNQPVLRRTDFMGQHEWCFYGWKKGAGHFFNQEFHPSDVWDVQGVHCSKSEHLTEKPVELAKRAITYSSRPGENVLDLFGGSGSTLIGCEETGRNAYLMEIDALYCDVIKNRWEQFSGRKAERRCGGQS